MVLCYLKIKLRNKQVCSIKTLESDGGEFQALIPLLNHFGILRKVSSLYLSIK